MEQPNDLAPFLRRTDDSGHVYLVPVELRFEYDEMGAAIENVDECSDEWHELIDRFESAFGQYRIGGEDIVFWVSASTVSGNK